MDFKDILGKLDTLNEAEMTSRKVAGKAYGGSAQADDEDEDEEKKPSAPAVKRGRGRPRKAGGEADTSARYSGAKDLQSWIVGSVPKKPSKELSKLPATKHKLSDKEPEKKKVKESLKDWITELDQLMESDVEEAAKWRQGYRASGHPAGFKHKSGEVGPIGGSWDEVETGPGEFEKVPVQRHRDIADPLSSRDKTKLSQKGTPLTPKYAKSNLKHAIKGSLGKHGPVGQLPEAEQLTIEPAKASTQVIKQGTKVLGQVSNPQLASTIKSAIGKGEMSLAGAELGEADYSAKAARAGKDIGKPGKQFAKIAKSAGEKYGSKERGEKVAGAVLAKLRKTNEADMPPNDSLSSPLTLEESDKPKSYYELGLKHGKEGKEYKNPPYGVGAKAVKDYSRGYDEGKASKQGVAEAKNHMDETEYNTYAGWKAACRKAGADKFDGDRDICQAMKDGKGIGEWDGEKGSVYDDSHKKKKVAEGKSSVKHDDKAEKAGKKVAKDIEYDEKVKDKIHGKKRHAEDEKAERAGKKVAKDIEYDEKKSKKKVDESMDHRLKSAHHRGKAHALAKEGYNCRYDEGSEEARMYHEGYKMGLDECYGIMPMRGVVVGEGDMEEGMMGAALGGVAGAALGKTPSAAITGAELGSTAQDMFTGEDMDQDIVDDMASFGALGEEDMEEGNAFTAALAKTPKGGKFTVGGKTFTDKSDYNAKVDEMMMAFEGWDKQLNELLTEGEKVDEGMSISVSKGQQGSPDSVSVTASDTEADKLMALVKQLGVFGAEESHSDYGAPTDSVHSHGDLEVVDDHDGMMALMKKMSGQDSHEDYADEMDYSRETTCEACGGMMEEGHSCGDKEMVDEVESEDQQEFEVAEDNAPDSEEAETTADEDAEAKEDEAIAQYRNADKDVTVNEEQLDEWANDAGKDGTDTAFMRDIEFMTRTIAGGLNKEKSTGQTTIPVIAGQSSRMGVDGVNESADSLVDLKKLSGIR